MHRLTSLYLDSNWLIESLPSSIGNLSRLFILTLISNILLGPILGSMRYLTSLNSLDISFLTFNIPSSRENLSRILELLESNNRLSRNIPKSLVLPRINLDKICLDRNLLSFLSHIPSSIYNPFTIRVYSKTCS